MCWKPCSSCWSLYLLREEFLWAPIHSPPLWFAVSVIQNLDPVAVDPAALDPAVVDPAAVEPATVVAAVSDRRGAIAEPRRLEEGARGV
jgi:hypothetical protein